MKTPNPHRVLLLAIGVLFTASACHQDSLEILVDIHSPISTDSLTSFADDLMPVLDQSCSYSGCHDGSNPLAPALTTYGEVRPQAESVVEQVTSRAMPIGSSLLPGEIDLFVSWLEQGALNN